MNVKADALRMSFLRVQPMARIARSASTVNKSSGAIHRRLASSKSLADNSSEQNQDSYLSNAEDPKQSTVDHQVDLDMHIDHATSCVSNVSSPNVFTDASKGIFPNPPQSHEWQ